MSARVGVTGVLVAVVLVFVAGGAGAQATESPEPSESTAPTTVLEPVEVMGSNVERVTTTQKKVRRVVVGLVAIGGVSAALTIAFAHHTSPRRRYALAAGSEGEPARRVAPPRVTPQAAPRAMRKDPPPDDPSPRPNPRPNPRA